MRLVFAEPAARDLEDIIAYIACENPGVAETVYRRIVEAARRLPRFPALGRPGRVPDTRELGVASLPFVIVYQADAQAVTVLAVFHTARDLTRGMRGR